jgi:hypothetical protein
MIHFRIFSIFLLKVRIKLIKFFFSSYVIFIFHLEKRLHKKTDCESLA